MELLLFLVVCVGVCRNLGVYSSVGRVGPHHGKEGGVERRIFDDANVPLVYSSLWHHKVHRVGI